MIKCPKCGFENGEGSIFCSNCGEKFENLHKNQNNGNGNFSQYGNGIDEAQKLINNLGQSNANYLFGDEEVVIAKGKWTIIPFILIWGIVFLALLIYTITTRNIYYYVPAFGAFATVFLWIVLIITCALSIILFLMRRELVLTNKKLYARVGLIGTKQYIIPLKKIHYISIRYSIIGRILNSAKIFVFPGTVFGIGFNFLANSTEMKTAIEKQVYSN